MLKHLRTHRDTALIWIREYKLFQGSEHEFKVEKMDESLLRLVKFFIRRNIALEALKDQDLRQVFDKKIGKYSFTEKILPGLILFLRKNISLLLQKAVFIALIVDSWSNDLQQDFMAVCAVFIFSNMSKKI